MRFYQKKATSCANKSAKMSAKKVKKKHSIGTFLSNSVLSLVIGLATISSAQAQINQVPVLGQLPTLETIYGQLYTYDPQATDPEGGALTYEVRSLPGVQGLSVDSAGVVTWTPTRDEVGKFWITFIADDGQAGHAGENRLEYELTVTDPNNQLPVIGQQPATTTNVGETYSYDLQATDGDDDAMTYSVWSWPIVEGLSISSAGVVTWIPTREDTGTRWVGVVVGDGHLGEATLDYQLTVVDPNNLVPVFTTTPSTAATVGVQYQYAPATTDGNGDTVSYNFYHAPTGMTIDPATGLVLWTPSTEAPSPGEWVKIQADDGYGGITRHDFQIIVAASGSNPNSNPVINPIPDTTAPEGDAFSYDIVASDPDGDPVTITLTTAPTGMSLDASDNIQWTPDYSQAGVYEVVVEASDGRSGISEQSFTITVTDINRTPEATAQSVTAYEDTAIAITLAGTDDDNDPLSFTVDALPTKGTLSGTAPDLTYTPNANESGSDSFQFYVNDGQVNSAVVTVTITINAVNDAPVLQFSPAITAEENLGYSTTVSATDIDSTTITYTLDIYPERMTIVPDSGIIYWVPDYDDAGAHFVTVVATDEQGALDRVSFILTVSNTNRLPQLDSIPDQAAVPASSYSYTASASDEDTDDVLLYSLISAPAGMLINEQSGIISWTIPVDAPDTVAVTVQVDDQSDGIATQDYTIAIHSEMSNVTPVISSSPITVTNEQALYQYDVEVTDSDDAEFTFELLKSPQNALINPLSGVLSWLPGVEYAQSNALTNTQCQLTPIVATESLNVVQKWQWLPGNADPFSEYNQVMMTPLVAQTNDDNGDGWINTLDIPDIIFTAFSVAGHGPASAPGYIRIISGADGSDLAILDQHSVETYSNIAVADIDNDGVIEIIAMGYAGRFIMALELNGDQVWINTTLKQGYSDFGGPTIADLDGDGTAEIIVNGGVLSAADGSFLWSISPYSGGVDPYSGVPIAADLDGDGLQEVIVGGSAYSASGDLLWDVGHDGFTAVGNLDDDSDPEIALVSSGKLHIISHLGAIQWSIDIPDAQGRGGPPVIADFDGDGLAEIGVVGSELYTVFKQDETVLWSQTIDDPSSEMTGASAFDFNGDGSVEVVYADQSAFWIFNGADGSVLHSESHSSASAYEYPVVADIDNDGHAEIIVVENNAFWGGHTGIRVFEDADDQWVDARSIWNQHAYSIDNINEDGSIPTQPAKSWETHNSFRLNTFPDGSALDQADLRAGHILYNDDTSELTVQVQNRGLVSIDASFSLRIYNGDPANGGVLISNGTVSSLAAGEEQFVTFSSVDAILLTNDIYLVVDEEQAISDCQTDNNQSIAALIKVKVSDSYSDSDEQLYLLNVEDVNEAPTITSEESSFQFGVEDDVSITVQTEDLDIGDVTYYSLVGAPDGVTIDAKTGKISWAPTVDQSGVYSFTVVATDLAGANDTQTITITVVENLPPVIESTPVTTVDSDQNYAHTINASDPNNDSVSYRLDTAPANSVLDATTGLLEWSNYGDYELSSALTNNLCVMPALSDLDSLNMQLKWGWTSQRVLSIPLVSPLIDTNADGVIDQHDDPAVIFVSHEGPVDHSVGYLRVVNGVDGSEIWSLDDPALRTEGSAHPAVGDIDGDGIPEIVMYLYDGGVAVINNDKSLKWTSPYPGRSHWRFNYSGITLADIDADGNPEILARDHVLNSNGSLKWFVPLVQHNISAVAADLNLDGLQEVIVEGAVYNHLGELLWTNSEGGKYAAVGNFDADPYPEVVFSSTASVSLYEHDGTLIWSEPHTASVGSNGYPVIADVDGDGMPEIGLAGSTYYVVFNHDGTELWRSDIYDPSRAVGSTAFDFNGDGRSEIIHSDHTALRIFDGLNGDTVYAKSNTSTTAGEYSYVADVDGDGRAELLTVSETYKLRVFEDVNDAWPDTRSIWNQYNYSIDNINDDASIPVQPAKGWQTHNSYRQNMLPDRSLPDLRVHSLSYDDVTEVLSATVTNRGLAATLGSTTVAFYNGDAVSEGLIHSEPINALAKDESIIVAVSNISPDQLTASVTVTVNENKTLGECLLDNNLASAALMRVQAKDSLGLIDSQTYLVSVGNVNDAPQVVSPGPGSVTAGSLYSYPVLVSDPDTGDAHSYVLNNALPGMLVSEQGEISWQTTSDDVGSYIVDLIVTDLAGASTEQAIYIEVIIDPNNAPVISSTPITSVNAETLYQYLPIVSDIDGDTWTFSLTLSPTDMTIDEVTGQIDWTPQLIDYGLNEVVLNVTDSRGKKTQQQFTLLISIGDHSPPDIVSDPPLSASVGQLYRYTVQVDDGGNTVFTYGLSQGPGGMTVSPSGVYEWIPTANEEGSHSVTVDVSDGVYRAAQTFIINAANANAANIAAEIISVAPKAVNAGQQYQYAVVATDIDGGVLSYTLDAKPAAMMMDANGVITWSATSVDIGDHSVGIVVSDGQGGVTRENFTLTVYSDEVPVFISMPATRAIVGQHYQYAVSAVDLDGDTIVISMTSSVPGMSFVDNVLDWAPTAEQLGENLVSFSVSDGVYTVVQTFNISVSVSDPANTQPVISSVAPNAVSAGRQYSYAVAANDPDNDPLSYVLETKPAGMEIDANGLITWNTSVAEIDNHAVEVAVYDGRGGYARQGYSIIVYPDVGPIITSVPSNSAAVNTMYQYTITAIDFEGETISFNLVNPLSGTSLADNVLSWTPTESQMGIQSIVITASDGNVTNTQSFNVLVTGNEAPEVTSIAPITAVMDELYSYQILIDDEGGAITYQLLEGPDLLDVSASGLVTWQPSATQKGPQFVSIRISDQEGASTVYEFVVYAVNDDVSPVIISKAITFARTELGYSYQLEISDVQGGPFAYQLNADAIAVGMTLDDNGLMLWSPTENDLGYHTVQITVSDEQGNSDQQSYQLKVTAPGLYNRRVCE